MKKLMITMICAFVLTGIMIGITNFKASETRGLNFGEPKKEQTSGSGVTYAVAMILGILCGHLYRSMEGEQGKVSIRALINQLQTGALWRSLLASPIIFGVVYSAAGKQPDFVLACVFAFENGFLCPVILKGKLQPQDAGAANRGGQDTG